MSGIFFPSLVLSSLIENRFSLCYSRYHKCLSCYEKLSAIRAILLKKQSTGKLGATFRELAVLIRNLEWPKLRRLRPSWIRPPISSSVNHRRFHPDEGLVATTAWNKYREAAMKSTVTSYRGRHVCKNWFFLLLLPLFSAAVDRLSLLHCYSCGCTNSRRKRTKLRDSLLVRIAERVEICRYWWKQRKRERKRVSMKVRKEKSLMKNEVR